MGSLASCRVTFSGPRGRQDGPRGPEEAPETAQEGPKTPKYRSRTPKLAFRRPRRPPRRPKTSPRWPQDAPRHFQDVPRCFQDALRRALGAPRRLHDAFLMDFGNQNGSKLTPKSDLEAILCSNSVTAKEYDFPMEFIDLSRFGYRFSGAKSNQNRLENRRI